MESSLNLPNTCWVILKKKKFFLSKYLYSGQGQYFWVYTATVYGLPKLSNQNTMLKISKVTLHVLPVTTMHLNTLRASLML